MNRRQNSTECYRLIVMPLRLPLYHHHCKEILFITAYLKLAAILFYYFQDISKANAMAAAEEAKPEAKAE